mmetsp:Transcript_31373/g.82516  ORF Transcript_31373/g.82516 Transcript_31373/m.82516 type:complete len:478 (+) Transcript_31373:76-1509(+)
MEAPESSSDARGIPRLSLPWGHQRLSMSCGDLGTPRGARSPRFGNQAQSTSSSSRPLPSARGGRQSGGTSLSQPPAGATSSSLSARLSAGSPMDAPSDGGSSRRPNPLLGHGGNTPASARNPQRSIRSPPISPMPASAREASRYEKPMPSPPLHRRGGRDDRIFDRDAGSNSGGTFAQSGATAIPSPSPQSPLASPSPDSAAARISGVEDTEGSGDAFSRRDTDAMYSPMDMGQAEEPLPGSMTCDKIQVLCGQALRLVYNMGTPAAAMGAFSHATPGHDQRCEASMAAQPVPEIGREVRESSTLASDGPAMDPRWENAMAELADLRARTLRAEAALDLLRQDGQQRCTDASPAPVAGETATLGREIKTMGKQLAEMREEVQRTNDQIWTLVQHLSVSHASAASVTAQQQRGAAESMQQAAQPQPPLPRAHAASVYGDRFSALPTQRSGFRQACRSGVANIEARHAFAQRSPPCGGA